MSPTPFVWSVLPASNSKTKTGKGDTHSKDLEGDHSLLMTRFVLDTFKE